MSAPTPLLSVRDLKVHFPVKSDLFAEKRVVKAVDGVSFDLYPGETLGIVGESGCGKSTLGRAVLKLIPSSAGKVVWLGRPLEDASKNDLRGLRRDMQIIFQDPLAALDPRMTVGSIVGEPLDTFEPGLADGVRRQRIVEAMERVGLPSHLINRYPHEFSGGQCQRIGIARALILRPKLLVCDEPVSALDVSIQAQIINLLEDLQNELGLTYVFIAHDLSIVRHISDRVAVMYLGKIVEIGERDEVYERPLHPYTRALLSSVPVPDRKRGATRGAGRIRLGGEPPSPVDPPSGCSFHPRCWKAQELCRQVEPLLEVKPGLHRAACHFPELGPAATAAG
jgi:oligopeptide transport system ATP-binding protein